jgi:hypothetical protein
MTDFVRGPCFALKVTTKSVRKFLAHALTAPFRVMALAQAANTGNHGWEA